MNCLILAQPEYTHQEIENSLLVLHFRNNSYSKLFLICREQKVNFDV